MEIQNSSSGVDISSYDKSRLDMFVFFGNVFTTQVNLRVQALNNKQSLIVFSEIFS